jgi:hypothetical protein
LKFSETLSPSVIENAPTLSVALRQLVDLGDLEDRV